MRLATWNVNSVGARRPRLVQWLEEAQPDVLCLQELKCPAESFPYDDVAALGYEAAVHADGRWNGVGILSRVGMSEVTRGFPGDPGFPEPESRAVAATCGPLRVWSLYVPNGRSVDDPHYSYKLAWLTALRDVLAEETAAAGAFAVCGDFNIAPTDDDVWDPAAFVGSTHVTDAERKALQALLDLGLHDLPPRIAKGAPFTYWDYRAGNFHKGMGMRIDLVLADERLRRGVRHVWIDREARKGKGPSDHAPLVVDADLPAGTDPPA